MTDAKLLVQYGFLSKDGDKELGHLKPEERKKFMDRLDEDNLKEKIKEWVSAEKAELHIGSFSETGYPKPVSAHRLIYENYQMSIEEMYY